MTVHSIRVGEEHEVKVDVGYLYDPEKSAGAGERGKFIGISITASMC